MESYSSAKHRYKQMQYRCYVLVEVNTVSQLKDNISGLNNLVFSEEKFAIIETNLTNLKPPI